MRINERHVDINASIVDDVRLVKLSNINPKYYNIIDLDFKYHYDPIKFCKDMYNDDIVIFLLSLNGISSFLDFDKARIKVFNDDGILWLRK